MPQNKIIYEVNLSVQKEIDHAYKDWLSRHVEEMLRIDGFEKAEIAESETGPDSSDTEFSVRYTLSSAGHLKHYFDYHAEKMRGDGLARFDGKFAASRRVLKLNQIMVSEP